MNQYHITAGQRDPSETVRCAHLLATPRRGRTNPPLKTPNPLRQRIVAPQQVCALQHEAEGAVDSSVAICGILVDIITIIGEMNCSTTELIVRYSYCSARVRYSLRRPDDYIAGIHDATGSPTLPGQLSQVWACTSQIVTVTKTDNGSLATGFDIYRRGAAADHPEPGTGGSLAARPLQPPAHHWTRSPNHPITKSLVPILAMGRRVVTPTVSVGATELANAATSASTRL